MTFTDATWETVTGPTAWQSRLGLPGTDWCAERPSEEGQLVRLHELGQKSARRALLCPARSRMIHDRMPVILHPVDYPRWLSDLESDPRDPLKPLPSEMMTMLANLDEGILSTQ